MKPEWKPVPNLIGSRYAIAPGRTRTVLTLGHRDPIRVEFPSLVFVYKDQSGRLDVARIVTQREIERLEVGSGSIIIEQHDIIVSAITLPNMLSTTQLCLGTALPIIFTGELDPIDAVWMSSWDWKKDRRYSIGPTQRIGPIENYLYFGLFEHWIYDKHIPYLGEFKKQFEFTTF